jgi:SCP-2 sterol transfer family
MEGRQPDVWAENAQLFEADPVLSDFVRPFPDTVRGKRSDFGASFKRIAETVAKGRRAGTIQFTIQDGRSTRRWCLTITPDGSNVSESRMEKPDLEILTDAESWAEVAPLEAFGRGRLRVRGDIELARVVAKRMRR